jgi:phosphoenolpyruvate carboxylase
MPENLRIHQQVHICGTLLGNAVAHTHGKDSLTLVESLRKHAADTRDCPESNKKERLVRLMQRIDALSPEETLWVAKAFSIYLALINACENAFRTSRLKETFKHENAPLNGCLVYVLTAHPTEIRSAPSISLSRRITEILVGWFARGEESPPLADEKHELSALINMLWQIGIHKDQQVTPADEVEHIVGQFSNDILSEILELRRRGADLRFRTWVGGDKDGHPGINATTLHTSFRGTRKRLYTFFESRLESVKHDFQWLGNDIPEYLKKVERALLDVRNVTTGDGIRMNTLRRTVNALAHEVQTLLGDCPVKLLEMTGLLELFPGMVLPVELREESTVFLELQKKNATGIIGRMLRKGMQIAEGGLLRHYVQGLIISMTRSTEDIEAAVHLVDRIAGTAKSIIPIIPLFERGEDLDAAPVTVDSILQKNIPALDHKASDGTVNKKMEIMLGYSDTSKRMGAFASRRRIFHAMHELTAVCGKHGIEPIFFHGAGGSVTRGGGSIEEQSASWPDAARNIIKLTVQGEMVERTMATPEIFRRGIERLLSIAAPYDSTTSSSPASPGIISSANSSILDELAHLSVSAFENLVKDENFRHFVATATPYPDLCVLRLGSRPSHRPGKATSADLASLRAIPWVLCFTQTRLLVPSWYGIGTAFEIMRKNPVKLEALKKAFDSDKAFKGFVKLMGFSLAKGDRAVFSLFADTLTDLPELKTIKNLLLREEKRVTEMVRFLSGHVNLLWFRPWLSESIRYRGSTIHPLSAIEISALLSRHQQTPKPKTNELLRISIAGTAIGMLTTG